MTRIVVESALVGSAVGLAVALLAHLLARPLDPVWVGAVAGMGAGVYAAIRAWREG